jgi:hypothetical protein
MLTTSSTIRESVLRKNIDGINIIYLKVDYNQQMSIGKRLTSFICFMLKSTNLAFKLKNVDLVIATSTPLTVGFPALMMRKIRKIKYIFEVRDLWPEVPIQMKGLNNPLLIKLVKWFEKKIYKNSIHIVSLSPGMVEGVK